MKSDIEVTGPSGQVIFSGPLAELKTRCVIDGIEVPADRMKNGSTTCSQACANERKRRLRVGDNTAQCVVCCEQIGPERQRYRAITCAAHQLIRKAAIRSRVDLRRCRFCRKPSTPMERAAYRRFRSLEVTQPHLLYPVPFKHFRSTFDGDEEAAKVEFSARLQAGFDANGEGPELDLMLVDRRSASTPGGARSGMTPTICVCGHSIQYHRRKNKKHPGRHCGKCDCTAMRTGDLAHAEAS